ncbi:MAG: sialidase, partial [Gemmatimonadota bacterium]
MPARCSRRLLAVSLLLAVAALVPAHARAQRGGGPPQATRPGPLRFEFLGPAGGGRFASVAGVPGAPGTYYGGAASGGIWKTTDGGTQWEPIFDDQEVAAIGTLAVAPSDPRIVWAGTGEAWAIRDADVTGDGVYKSMDEGATWRNMGLPGSGRVGRIVIHPTDPNTVYVCALGRTTGPQEDKGVYKTTDGGETWQRILFVDEITGCSGLAMDPADPDHLIAGMWQVEMHTWGMFGGGPSSGVWATRDGGRRWSKLSRGLPKSPVGKIDVAFAPSNSQRVYVLAQTVDQGAVWRSEDGGGNWNVVSWDRTLTGRAGYYIRLLVSPSNPDEILVATSSMHTSSDGGKTFTTIGGCGDCHDIWWDPENADHYALTGDGGLSITLDHGRTRTSVSLPIGQMYHVAVDTRIPYWVYSNRQDNGTMRGPSNAPELPDNVPSYQPQRPGGRGGRGGGGGFGGGRGGGASWDHGVGGCESGFTIPDPSNPDIVWATCYGNKV